MSPSLLPCPFIALYLCTPFVHANAQKNNLMLPGQSLAMSLHSNLYVWQLALVMYICKSTKCKSTKHGVEEQHLLQ